MRNHLNWLFLVLLGIAMIGCQDDITVNDPITNTGLNKSSSAAKYVEENLTTDLVVTGSGIVAAGTGTENIGGGVINITVPAGAIINKVYMYWEGRYDVTSGTPDNDCVVNGTPVVGELIGKAALDNPRPAYTHRADITGLGLVVPGNNTLIVTGFTNAGGYYINRPNGAGVIVVYSEPGKESDIEIRDGCDFSYVLEGTFANYTNKQSFTFPAEAIERQATLHMFIGDLLDDEKTGNMRPHFLRYKIGAGTEQTIYNPFSQNGGPEWETYALNLTIPAGVTQVDVEVQSGPGKAGDRPEPASLTWVAATLTVPKVNVLAEVGDRIWKDLNKNGIQDPGEEGFPGVTVALYTCDPNAPDDGWLNLFMDTDANGIYFFKNLEPGTYKIRMNIPDGWELSPKDQGTNDKVDSDFLTSTAGTYTECFTLDPGESDSTWDGGLYPNLGQLGDRVWRDDKDRDCNGIQGPTEVGVEGVTVQLYDCATPTPNFIKETTTNASGEYLFTDLPTGCYKVKFVLPAGFDFTAMDQGTNDSTDSDVNPADGFTADISLGAGEVNTTVDAGLCPKLGEIGDKVWRDDKDKDCNGIQDPTEVGVERVTVQLYDCATPTPNFIKETKTNASGEYLFTDLPAGCYKVKFVLPAGFDFTAMDQGTNDSTDSDANPADGFTADISLGAGESNRTVDAGLCPKLGQLGDKVWRDNKDKDCNGIQDPTELGVEGVTVQLYDCASPTPNFIKETKTNASGEYLFTDLPEGCYKVKFVLPAGFEFTSMDQGTNDAVDSDVNPADGFTASVNLGAGESNRTVDAGLCPLLSELGDFVWLDINKDGIQNSNELGIQNIKVDLFDCFGNYINSAYTNTNGYYLFDNLQSGQYKVKFNLPINYAFSPKDQGGNDEKDSDAGTDGFTSCITLPAGTIDLKWDAGIYYIPSPCIDGVIGGIDLGGLVNKYLFFFADGRNDANWQGATKGFAGNVLLNGVLADERTSGDVPYAGTIYTNDDNLGAWQKIVDQNSGQAFSNTGNTQLVSDMKTKLMNAFNDINALTATSGYSNRSSSSLDGLNTQNGKAETFVINITSGFQVSSKINIIGDADDSFILRWDSDANFSNGYQGIVKFQSGGAIVPKGNLTAGNFIHVAGDINASGGGSNPPAPYPQGPRLNNGTGTLINGGKDFSGGGFFTGYWLTTGDPSSGKTQSLSNAIFVGGWYTLTNQFSMTSGTSGVYVSPNCPDNSGKPYKLKKVN